MCVAQSKPLNLMLQFISFADISPILWKNRCFLLGFAMQVIPGLALQIWFIIILIKIKPNTVSSLPLMEGKHLCENMQIIAFCNPNRALQRKGGNYARERIREAYFQARFERTFLFILTSQRLFRSVVCSGFFKFQCHPFKVT